MMLEPSSDSLKRLIISAQQQLTAIGYLDLPSSQEYPLADGEAGDENTGHQRARSQDHQLFELRVADCGTKD